MDKYLKNIKSLIEENLVETKYYELRSNNHKLLTYHNIGKLLVEAQGGETRAKYGNGLIKSYSIDLTKEYGKGYDVANLKRMRQFYIYYSIGAPVWHQLNWSHFKTILPMKDENKRNYYLNSVIENNFSSRQLEEYIKTNAFERLLNKNVKLKYLNEENNSYDIIDMIKSPILITIDKAKEKVDEKALRKYILKNIESVMLELGIGMSFVGSERPIKLNNKTYRPDLVFFNYKLNCFIILELKIDALKINNIGQIEFYVNVYDKDIKEPFHNPTIGIVISERVDEEIISYNPKDNIKHIAYDLVEGASTK